MDITEERDEHLDGLQAETDQSYKQDIARSIDHLHHLSGLIRHQATSQPAYEAWFLRAVADRLFFTACDIRNQLTIL